MRKRTKKKSCQYGVNKRTGRCLKGPRKKSTRRRRG